MAVTWPESCRTGTAGSPAAWLQTTSEPLARLVWLLHFSSFLGVCEQNMMCLILADRQYLCCISRVLFVFNWYPGSCQRPVKAILTPAYSTATTYEKRIRNRTSKDWWLLHYHFPASGSRSAASLQGEETKEVDNIHPLHYMCAWGRASICAEHNVDSYFCFQSVSIHLHLLSMCDGTICETE